MDKNWVSMEQHYCPICGKMFDTGRLLLDKRFKKSMDRNTCTGIDLCPEHQAMVDSGDYRAFFVCNGPGGERTGEGFMIKTEAAKQIFNREVGPINHCGIEIFRKMQEAASDAN